MVKNNNNKVNNYINIVNDLKGLGLLNKRKKRIRQSNPQQAKVIYKPQGISGIEKVIIDNSPQLRIDVMQLANERSLLDERVMENEKKMDFIQKEIYTNPFRFAQPSTFGGQRNLSNVQGDSLYLPSFNQLYDKEIKLERDSIDVPIVDASNEFKRNDEPVTKENEAPVVETKNNENVEESSIKPKVLFKDESLFNQDIMLSPPRIRNTSPKPKSPNPKTPSIEDLAKLTPKTQKVKITDISERKANELLSQSRLLKNKEEFVQDLVDDQIRLTEVLVNSQMVEDRIKERRDKFEKERKQSSKEPIKIYIKEPIKELTSEQIKRKQAIERREIQKQIEESKSNENPTLSGLAKERELQDSATNLILDEYFSKLGGRKYVEENLDKDMQELFEFTKTGKVLNKTNDPLLYNKFYGYIRLSGKSENASGKGYSQTSIISKLGDMADKIRARLRIAKKLKVAPSRAPSRGQSRIRTMEDLNTETLNTTFKSI